MSVWIWWRVQQHFIAFFARFWCLNLFKQLKGFEDGSALKLWSLIVYSWNRTLGQQWPFFEFTCQDMFVAGEHATTENNSEYKVYKVYIIAYIIVYIVARLAFFSLARLARVFFSWSQSWARWLRTMVTMYDYVIVLWCFMSSVS